MLLCIFPTTSFWIKLVKVSVSATNLLLHINMLRDIKRHCEIQHAEILVGDTDTIVIQIYLQCIKCMPSDFLVCAFENQTQWPWHSWAPIRPTTWLSYIRSNNGHSTLF